MNVSNDSELVCVLKTSLEGSFFLSSGTLKNLISATKSLTSLMEYNLGDILKQCLISELREGALTAKCNLHQCLATINFIVEVHSSDVRNLNRFIARIIIQVFTLFRNRRTWQGKLATDLLVSTTQSLFQNASRKTLARVANKPFWRYLRNVLSSDCNYMDFFKRILLTSVVIPVVDKLPDKSKRHFFHPHVLLELRGMIHPRSGGDFDHVTKIELTRLYEKHNLEDVLIRYYSKWKLFVQACEYLLEDRRSGPEFKALAGLLREKCSICKMELIKSGLPSMVNKGFYHFGGFTKRNDDNVKKFIEAFIVLEQIEGKIVNLDFSAFENLVDLAIEAVSYLGPKTYEASFIKCPTCLSKCSYADGRHGRGRSWDDISNCLNLLRNLYFINENWYQWYDLPAYPNLIERENFEIWDIDEMEKICSIGHDDVMWAVSMTSLFPPAMPFSTRIKMHKYLNSDAGSHQVKLFEMRRDSLLNDLKTVFDEDDYSSGKWCFKFKGDVGIGPGPTKEVYSSISREFQRHDLNLWTGEPHKAFDKGSWESGEACYTHSPNGLYPKVTKDYTNANVCFELLGKTIAKALQDDQTLDIPLSTEFFRLYLDEEEFRKKYYDLPKVLPITTAFFDQLLSVKRRKAAIEADSSIRNTEKLRLIGNLKFDDGCSLDDLFINFTLPGEPEIEIMEQGRNAFLSPWNVDLYLDSLASVAVDVPTKMSWFRNGVEGYVQSLNLFLAEELKSLLCGEYFEEWSTEYLKSCCAIGEGLTLESKSVVLFFQAISMLDGPRQSSFLKFVTASPRLPCGGLRALLPPLTVVRMPTDSSEVDRKLPCASTCSNLIFLPEYTSLEVTLEKLLYAMSECRDSFQFL